MTAVQNTILILYVQYLYKMICSGETNLQNIFQFCPRAKVSHYLFAERGGDLLARKKFPEVSRREG